LVLAVLIIEELSLARSKNGIFDDYSLKPLRKRRLFFCLLCIIIVEEWKCESLDFEKDNTRSADTTNQTGAIIYGYYCYK
jgi:hypothetical protein